jgi:hypothetical protein
MASLLSRERRISRWKRVWLAGWSQCFDIPQALHPHDDICELRAGFGELVVLVSSLWASWDGG